MNTFAKYQSCGKLLNLIVFSGTGVAFILLQRRYAKVHVADVKENVDAGDEYDTETLEETSLEEEKSLKQFYQPWKMTPSAFSENEKGWVYVRGHILGGQNGCIVWYRPGLHKISIDNYEAYFRVLINGVETCITHSKQLSSGLNDKCNVVLDASNVGLSFIPSMDIVKKILFLFDSFFPGHLGNLVIVNLAGVGQLFFKMVMPFLSKETRSKIHVLPVRKKKRMNMLKSLIQVEYIPAWLDGSDSYIFDPEHYYKSGKYKTDMFTDQEGLEYNKLVNL